MTNFRVCLKRRHHPEFLALQVGTKIVHELLEGDFNAIMFNHTVVKQFKKGGINKGE